MAKKTPQPRFCGRTAQTADDGTWLEPEEFCYPNGGMTRRAYATFPDGINRVVKCAHIKAERSLTPTYPTLESLFEATVTDFCIYNANCHETGTYAAFYVRSEK